MEVLPKMVRDRISGLIDSKMEEQFQIITRKIIDDLTIEEGFNYEDVKEWLKDEIDKK